jgi:hypothetical protein
MKLYTLYSDSHKVLFDEWFYPSFKSTNSDLLLIHKLSEQFCSSGNYMDAGWKETMIEKDNFIIQSLEDAQLNEIIIHTDVDIQFFKNITKNLDFNIFDTYDIICQADAPNAACFGFMIMKNTEKLKQMFKEIVKIVKQANDQSMHHVNDQRVLNSIHRSFDVKLGLLDYRYFSNWMTHNLDISKSLFSDFQAVDSNNIPSNLVLHHANYVVGVQTKIDLMNKIKKYQK